MARVAGRKAVMLGLGGGIARLKMAVDFRKAGFSVTLVLARYIFNHQFLKNKGVRDTFRLTMFAPMGKPGTIPHKKCK